MKKETALEFLFFSYFRIDFKDAEDKNKLIEAAIDRAYVDASNHVLRLKKDNIPKGEESEIRKRYKSSGAQKIKEALEGQDTVKDVYEKLKKVYSNPNLPITLGITQKWYNMTVKYLYIMNLVLNEIGNTVLEELCQKYVGRIDIPVDDYIIRAACSKGVCVPCKNKDNTYSDMKDTYSNKIPWSKWDQVSSYQEFQNNIKNKFDNDSILDGENRMWIDEAKRRNNFNI